MSKSIPFPMNEPFFEIINTYEKLPVKLEFSSMDDFSPAQLGRQIPAVAKLLQAREQLANLQRYMDGKVAAEDQLKTLLSDPELMKALSDQRAAKLESADTAEETDAEQEK